ncbi:hypothetical protein [Luteolibacter sp. AS25]|uniref:hypothetical protein n=1 Tax=Luteolibacter sp. AS25 TaxID=3135776 RepID=UPI00398A57E8
MRFRKWKRKLAGLTLALLVCIPLLGFGLSNLLLASKRGRDWFSGKITQRIHLESSIEKASWSPWNGLTIYGLRIEQPEQLRVSIEEPLLKVSETRFHPEWNALLKKQLRIRALDIIEPQLNIPVELLSALPRDEKAPPILVSNASKAQDPVQQPAAPEQTTKSSIVHEPAPIPQPAGAPQAAYLKPVWLNVTSGKVRVISTFTEQSLFSIGKIDGKMPITGTEAESIVQLTDIAAYGKILKSSLRVPVSLQKNILKIGEIRSQIKGVECHAFAKFALLPGIPYEVGTQILANDPLDLNFSETGMITLGKGSAQGRLQGYLLAPNSWQGNLISDASEIHARLAEQEIDFDSGRAFIMFQNGTLSCVDARLIGESMSILGNATLLTDGRTAGIARVVAPNDTLLSISTYTQQEITTPALIPLQTPQRSALDIQFFGTIWQLYFKPHPNAEPVSIYNR